MESIDIAQLADWLAGTDIDVLTLDAPAGRLRLRRGMAETAFAASTPSDAAATQGPPTTPGEDAIAVTAASVGIFLDRHPLRSTPLVQVGEPVAEGRLVGLLQVGALLLPVRAPCAGAAGALCVAPGSAVGHGTPLRHILPLAAH